MSLLSLSHLYPLEFYFSHSEMEIPSLRGILKTSIIYVIVLLVVGAIKIQIILGFLKDDYRDIISTVSYISLPLIALFVLVLVAVIFGITWHLLLLHKGQIELSDFIFSIRYFLFALIANETIKFSAIFIFFIDELSSLRGEVTEASLKETTFYYLSTTSDVFFVFLGVALCSAVLKYQFSYPKKIVLLNSLYLSLSIGFVYFLYRL